ncbi:uncharacterized protein LOC116032433 [Ipomoea triloba]|uniref:uncharacterized protein LOC116032433 n=1 Tax=Ipomoea triloba TaxID=35885 RepID=UPI00125D8C78|nr:uncharacterized protein LOC116032433 [Ipomoea triloba]XP_031130847.1 uncharacterized protein LOC116032433 [Ipomoea triloba]XP_031130848.1 uncharacterized protein LOC116032433 [Ipomoea triloba]XP_031130849.1 uncharacterized protein LOC116032433 [Ipomoea triloba]
MERNVGQGMMGQQKNYEQVGYSSVDTRNEGIGSANQRIFQDPSSSINTNIRPPDFNMPVGARPVLNFSIQTGEEFAFEFMRDRAFAKQHFIPHSTGEPSSTTSYMDLKDILGISHTGSESGSDISMIASVDKSRVQDPERRSTLNEEHAFSHTAQSVSRTTSRNNDGRGVHSRTISRPSKKLKFLCSFGGRILPRPSDGKLRYVGGDTRIIRVMRDISWDEFKEKISTVYSSTHIIKYQLPGEELDALVSVSCDEDLQNMMEECNVLEDGGSQKLRMFLFSSSDLDDSHLGLENVEGDTEFQYFVAVNGMDIGSRRNSVGLASTSGNNLDELLGLSIDREHGRVVANLAAVDTMHPVGGSANQSSHRVGSSSLHELDSNSQGYQNQATQYNGVEWQQLSTSQPIGNFSVIERKNTILPSAALSFAYGPRTTNYAQLAEDNFVLNSSHSQMTLEGGGLTAAEYPLGNSHVLDPEVSASEVKLKRDASIQKRVKLGKCESLEKEPKEEKMKRENSMQKMNEPEITRPLDYEKAVSSNPYDNSTPNNSSRGEEQISDAAALIGNSVVPSIGSVNNQDQMQSSLSAESDKEERIDAFNEDSNLIASSKVSNSGHGNSESYPFDFNSEHSTAPPRLFRSERTPREQAGLNRLSKSDDSSASPFLMAHSQSEGSQHMSESIDKFHDRNEASETKHLISSTLSSNQPAVEDKKVEFQKCEEVADNAKVVGSQISKDGGKTNIQNIELKGTVFPDRDTPSLPIRSGNFQNESASKPTENIIDDNNAMGEVKSLARREQPAGAASQVKPSVNEHGDILIDINDRFPRDFLSDIFSKAMDGSAGVAPLHGDGGGLSLNMENHEPKHWSFFKKLAHDDFVRRDVSLMDQDHPSFPTTNAHVDEVSMDYSYPTSKISGVVMDSHINIQADIHQQSPHITEPLTMNLPSDYNPSQVTGIQSMQSDGTINRKTPDSVYQDEVQDAQSAGFPPVDFPLVDFDINSLQIIKNEDLEELKELGSGTFGTVYHGKWRGTDVAIKRIKKSCFTGRSSEQERLTVEFWREADILSKLHHPNVVAFYGVVQDGPGGTLATVTEFMVNGSLRHVLLCKDRHLDRRKKLIIATDAAFGMEYLHSKNIVHFDLKCDNLLVNLKDPSRPICKVGDFGLSKIKRNTLVTGGVRGTLPWMAPELLNGSSNKVSEKVDVFSFGIVLWEILTGEEPYANMHYGAIIGGIVNNTLRPHIPNFCDPEWRMLMEQCWAPDPAARPSFTEIARRLRAMSVACPSRPQGHLAQTQQSK